MDSEVIVVGAGLSGLSAAKLLIEYGLKVIVIEATERVGGRLFTIHNSNVGYADLGGSYIGPTQDHILRMAKDLGVETYCIKEEEDLLHYQYGRRVRQADDKFKHKNPFVDMDINYLIRHMDKLIKEVPADCPWDAKRAEEFDTITFKEFLEKKCWTQEARTYFGNVLSLSTAGEPKEVSLLNYLWYLKQCQGFKRCMATENGAQERKFIGGSQQICEKLASIINNTKDSTVLLNSPAVEINQESADNVYVKTLDGKKLKTKYVILACAPAVQMKIHFKPPLPPLRNQLIQRLPMGTTTKCIIYYKTAFWRKKGLCGTIYIEGGDDHPMFLTMDDTKPDGNHPALIGFIAGDHCRRLLHLTSDERKEIIAHSLAEATGYDEFLKPIHYEEKNWMAEQYVGGCYSSIFPTGFFTQYGKALRTPIDRLYFGGTETAVTWSGYMNGAVEAGERAAREILYSLGKITRDQIWVEEPESEYCKAEPFPTTFEEKLFPSVSGFLKLVTLSSVLGTLTLAVAFLKEYWL